MTWATSADPWATGIRRDATRIPLIAHAKMMFCIAKHPATTVPVLAVAHLCLLVVLIPMLAEPGAIAMLSVSSLVLLGAAIAALGSRNLNDDGEPVVPQARTTYQPPTGLPDGSLAPSQTRAANAAAVIQRPPPMRQHLIRANAHNQDWEDLMARVSHELRTPLNAVLGFSDLMDRGMFGPLGHHRYQEYARHIHESGRDLLKSAEDTLAVTSLLTAASRHPPTEVVDLVQLTDDAWAFFGHLAQSKGVTLVAEIPLGTEVLCDRRSMRQMLVNLLSEGLTRSHAGMTITLQATAGYGRIDLQVAVPYTAAQSKRDPGSLDVCLARTLLEFHGATLVESLSEQTGWRASTTLESADQTDFFKVGPTATRPQTFYA